MDAQGGAMKKTWEKPVLIVLVRGRPEEAILTGCKSYTTLGADSDDDGCSYECEEWCFQEAAS
jgi:hypothetical protein